MNLYMDYRPSGCRDWSQIFGTIDALGGGATRDYTFVYPSLPEAGLHQLYVFLDSACDLSGSTPDKNIFGPLPIEIYGLPQGP